MTSMNDPKRFWHTYRPDDVEEDALAANHTGDLVAMFDPLMSGRTRRKKKADAPKDEVVTRQPRLAECALTYLSHALHNRIPTLMRGPEAEVVEVAPVAKPAPIKKVRKKHAKRSRKKGK
jgi:hypothetical protein